MGINNLVGMVRTEKIKRERAKAAGKLFAGMGSAFVVGAGLAAGVLFAAKLGKEVQIHMETRTENIAQTVKNTFQKKAEALKNRAVFATDEVCSVIKDVDRKMEAVKKDMKNGGHEITQDIHETAQTISKELN